MKVSEKAKAIHGYNDEFLKEQKKFNEIVDDFLEFIKDKRLVFDLSTAAADKVAEFHLSLSPFKQVVKDYWSICESYYDAVKNLPPGQIETIDMARRGIHNEGARILLERLEGKAEIDYDTSRRLFTLICVLHFGS